jgi:molybdate transport system substrate-binding protein
MRVLSPLLCSALLLGSCAPKSQQKSMLTIGAAANLTDVLGQIGPAFTKQSGVEVVFSYGSTAQLTQQIENGAPFDVFAAADTEHVDQLVKTGGLLAASRAVYARGQLALWIPQGQQTGVRSLQDLENPKVRFIAIAQPELAPYGQASVEALKAAHLWDRLQRKVVYSTSINLAKQVAASGNADAAFTAYSLVLHERGVVLKVDRTLYQPLDQALGILASSPQMREAAQFTAFLLGPQGRDILAKSGYLLP